MCPKIRLRLATPLKESAILAVNFAGDSFTVKPYQYIHC